MTHQEILNFIESSVARGESYATAAGNLLCRGANMADLVAVIVKGLGYFDDEVFPIPEIANTQER